MDTQMTTISPYTTASATRTGTRSLVLFFSLTLGWMAGCGGLAILGAHGIVTVPLAPLALISIGGLMPLLAALVATGYEAGRAGVRTLMAQVAFNRLTGRWCMAALLGMALIVLIALLLGRLFAGTWPPAPPAATWQTLPLLAVVYLIIALIEEVGWRGYALPRLQARYGALVASLLLGLIWGVWHLPQWLIPATGQADKWPFVLFLLHTVAFSILLTWLYNRNAGTLWPVILAHTAFNLYPEPWAAAWQMLPVAQRGLYPVILITVVEALTALLVVYLNANQQIHRRPLPWRRRVLLGLLIPLVVLAGSGATYQVLATARDARTFPPPGQLIDVGGYKLHLHCLGTGAPTVITENGLGGSSPDWGLVQPAVSQTTRICSYDRAGSGWSEASPNSRTSRQISAELHTLLSNAGVAGPFVLVGHSAGAMHVQLYAAQYPAEVAGLVLVDPTPAQAMIHFTPEQQRTVLPNLGQFRLLETLQCFGVLRLLPLFDDPVMQAIPATLQAQIRAQRLQSGAMTALATEAAGIEESIRQTAATTVPPDLPLLILWHGIPSEPVALEPAARASMEALAQQSKNGKFVVAEKSGHTIPLERPALVIDAINQVVAAVRTETPSSNEP